MKVNRTNFIDILSKVKPGISKKDIIEQSTHFIFTGKEVVTYNDQISVSYPFQTDFLCSVDADKFYKILSGISGDEIVISFIEDKLELESKKVKAKLATMKEGPIHELLEEIYIEREKGRWQKLPDDFIDGLFFCMFSASKDMSLAELTCIYVKEDIMVSSDDIRISQYKMEKGVRGNFLIPASSVSEIKKYEFTQFKIGEAWIYFKTVEGAVFSVRRMEGNFDYDWAPFFEVEGEEVNLPGTLKGLISSAEILAEGDFDIDKEIKISIEGKKVLCKGEGTSGWIELEEELDKEYSNLKFSINPIFLREILDKSGNMIVGDGRALFRSDKFQHVLALPVGE